MRFLLLLACLPLAAQTIKYNPFTRNFDFTGSGGGTAVAPYGSSVTAQTTLSVTAVAHGQGTDPIATCYEGSTPFVASACYYTKATNGDIVFTWSPAFTGRVVIIGGGSGATGPAGPPGESTPGFTPSRLVSGGGVAWVSGLNFTVGAATYTIGGVTYTSALTDLTVTTADPTNPRIDVFVVDTSGIASIIAGTPSATPAEPSVDPTTQLKLTFVYVAAAATTPSNVTLTNIYQNNAEWTTTASGAPFNVASTNNPYAGSLDVEGTAVVAGNYVQFVAPGTLDLGTFNNLTFYIRSKSTWAAARNLQLTWYNGATQRGAIVLIRDGQFGFSSSVTTGYQQIQVPASYFGINGVLVDRLRVVAGGSGGTMGMYMDAFTLQAGVTAASPSNAMVWKGAWSSAAAYAVNDTVSVSGESYVAIVANTNSSPPSTNWSLVGGVGANAKKRTFGATFVSSDGVTALTAGAKTYLTLPFSCTIAAWNIAVDAGTATIDIWKIATGTAIPTVANTITAAAKPAIAANTAARSTTLTGWTTAVAANDIIGLKLDAVATATYVNLTVECVQ